MPKEKYSVIKQRFFEKSNAFNLISDNTHSPLNTLTHLENIDCVEYELDAKEVEDIERAPDTIAIAPTMPIRLISPVADEGAHNQAAENEAMAWGIKAVQADTSPFNGLGIVPAILDTGINPTHQAFKGVELICKNFTEETDNDINGHGTHCAGTVFGRNVEGKRIGVASKVSKAVIAKVLGEGQGDSTNMVQAILWAAKQGADVISMSLGTDFVGFVKLLTEHGFEIEAATSHALSAYRKNLNLYNRILQLLDAQGQFGERSPIIVAASGNSSRRPAYAVEASTPAIAAGIIAVGALQRNADNHYTIATFSNTEPNICGPGVDILSAWVGSDQALKSINGTSMACPHVAGVACLFAQRQLEKLGVINPTILRASVKASGQYTHIAEGNRTVNDLGAGMVTAPQ